MGVVSLLSKGLSVIFCDMLKTCHSWSGLEKMTTDSPVPVTISSMGSVCIVSCVILYFSMSPHH